MAKGGKSGKRGSRNPNQRATGYKHNAPTEDMMDDEIDAFHKQVDIVPLNINEDMEGSDEDDEHPVFDFKDANDDEEDEDEDIGDDDGVVAKIARNLRAKIGGVDDEMYEDAEDEEDKKAVWGKRKNIYYSADNADYESSDEDRPAEEEAEALKMQKEKAKLLTLEDFGLEDVSQDESEREPTMEEILFKEKTASKALAEKDAHDDHSVAYEKVKKDLNALSKEEQMDVVYSSAPELVGLLSELNDAVEELENKVNPLLSKVKDVGNTATGGMHYMEVKQLLLLAYCQAISFYLLLKSEGQPVRDHPVIARLVEIKNLLDKMKQLDANLPSELEDILKKKRQTETVMKFLRDDVALTSGSVMNGHMVSNGTLEVAVVPHEAAQLVKLNSAQENENKGRNLKNTNNQVGVQSMEMLKVRAALEEKLKQKGIFSSVAPKRDKVQKQKQLLNGQLVTLDDFDDDATDKSEGNATAQLSSKLSQLITRTKKPKIISAEDDLPKRDDIGERRRKHELRVLAGAGIKYMDDDEGGGDKPDDFGSDEDTEMAEGGEPESEDDFYKQVKQQRAAKMAAKAEMYSRKPAMPSMPEETLVDGKRHISSQMEKNRGLTRPRKKLTKNPRKKYKLKHQKAVVRRKGQVRDIKKPTGPYGGETSGINAAISRSIRF